MAVGHVVEEELLPWLQEMSWYGRWHKCCGDSIKNWSKEGAVVQLEKRIRQDWKCIWYGRAQVERPYPHVLQDR